MLSAIEGELVTGAAFWALVAGLASSFGWGLGCLLFDRLQIQAEVARTRQWMDELDASMGKNDA